jgi:hypothetical protein
MGGMQKSGITELERDSRKTLLYFIHSHAKIKAGYLQSSLTPTYTYRARLSSSNSIFSFLMSKQSGMIHKSDRMQIAQH